jgi:hypothetical protein
MMITDRRSIVVMMTIPFLLRFIMHLPFKSDNTADSDDVCMNSSCCQNVTIFIIAKKWKEHGKYYEILTIWEHAELKLSSHFGTHHAPQASCTNGKRALCRIAKNYQH